MYTDLRVWLDHFDYHATRRCVMPEGRRLGLRREERHLISASIATFLRDSELDGQALLKASVRYSAGHAQSEPDALLPKIVALVVAATVARRHRSRATWMHDSRWWTSA